MSKVFGYPKFDENGEMILTTYDNEYKAMMMDIRVYSMKAGQIRTFKRDKEETAVLLLSGKVTYTWEDEKATVSRKDVFTEGPWALHVSGSKEITVTAEEDTEFWYSARTMTKHLQANCIHRTMHLGAIQVSESSEMWQSAV